MKWKIAAYGLSATIAVLVSIPSTSFAEELPPCKKLKACMIASVINYDDGISDPVQIGEAILNDACKDDLMLCVGNDSSDYKLVEAVRHEIAQEQAAPMVLKLRAYKASKANN